MKRILALALAAVLLLSGCGANKTGGDTKIPENTKGIVLGDVNLLIGGRLTDEDKETLGDPISTSEAPSCMYSGFDIIYEYDGFTLQTNQQSEDEIVCIITVEDSKYPTAKGIKVGDTADAVKDAYGDPADESDYYLVYETADNYDLSFSLSDGHVTVIEYAMRVED